MDLRSPSMRLNAPRRFCSTSAAAAYSASFVTCSALAFATNCSLLLRPSCTALLPATSGGTGTASPAWLSSMLACSGS
jgi:hypothetical protein